MTRTRIWRTAAVALVGSLTMAACGSTHHTSTPTTAGGATATTAPAGSTATTAPSASTASTAVTTPASTTPTTAAGPSRCMSSELTGSLGTSNGTAGTIYYPLTLTNSGNTTCILQGYPGVSFVTGSNGTQVGAPASRAPGSALPITLAPGMSASANLGIVDAGNYGTPCQITPVVGLRVYPPDETAAIFIAHADQGCANSADVVLHVTPFSTS